MAKGKLTTIAPHTYLHTSGAIEARARVTGLRIRTKMFTPGTKQPVIDAWIKTTTGEMRDEAKAFGDLPPDQRRRSGSSLEGDAPGYWRRRSGRPGSQADESHLRAWFEMVVLGARLGDLPRANWTRAHVEEAIGQWLKVPSPHAIRKVRVGGYKRQAVTVAAHEHQGGNVRSYVRGGQQAGPIAAYERAGAVVKAYTHPGGTVPGYERRAPATSGHVVAARTIRHRLRVARDLWRALDGEDVPTPFDKVKWPRLPKSAPITVDESVVVKTLQKLRTIDRLTFVRFALVAVTGQRPCQVGRALPTDIERDQRLWNVRGAKGSPARTVTLNDQMIAAWDAFAAAKAWGAFNTSTYGRRVHEAGWPKEIRPYAARHSIAKVAIRLGVSLGDVQGLLGHGDPTTTRIYAPFVVDRQHVVSTQLNGYLADVFSLKVAGGKGRRR